MRENSVVFQEEPLVVDGELMRELEEWVVEVGGGVELWENVWGELIFFGVDVVELVVDGGLGGRWGLVILDDLTSEGVLELSFFQRRFCDEFSLDLCCRCISLLRVLA